MKELIEIQRRLKAPKTQVNNVLRFSYRSVDDILEAVKPLLAEVECSLTLSDDILFIGERYYVRSTVTIRNTKGESESATAYAREAESKKGLDDSQVTGMASSYARKYALNGLFAIDDNKDADYISSKDDIDKAIEKVKAAKTADEVAAIWKDYPELKNNDTFRLLVTERGKELKKDLEKNKRNDKTDATTEPRLL